MTNQQKGMILAGLFLAWGGLTVYQMSDLSGSSSPDLSAAITEGHSTLPSVKDLSLEPSFPNSRQQVTFAQPRNIFSPPEFQKAVVTKHNIPSPQTPRPGIAPSISQPPGPSPADLAAQRARQQLNQFRFLGYLTKGGESQAFLTNGQAIYIVKQGEMLEGQVQVNKIEPETIVLSTQVWETGNQVQATIPLTPKTSS
jgi:Tfp pilus assembly protein PilP